MKKKLTLELDLNFFLLALVSNDKIYRLAWALNNFSDFSFSRTGDLEIIKKSLHEPLCFPLYCQYETDSENEFFLVGNKGNAGYLVPEIKTVNYFLILRGNDNYEHLKSVNEKIQLNPHVLNCFPIEVNNLKSKNNLII